MKTLFCVLLVLLFVPAIVSAQTQTTPNNRIAFDVPDVPDLATANASVYKLYVDALAPATLTHTCVAGTPITCSAPFPAMTQGTHALQVTRSQLVNNVLTESPKSSTLNILMLILAAPQNLRVQSGA